jgi:hypothetical protein
MIMTLSGPLSSLPLDLQHAILYLPYCLADTPEKGGELLLHLFIGVEGDEVLSGLILVLVLITVLVMYIHLSRDLSYFRFFLSLTLLLY